MFLDELEKIKHYKEITIKNLIKNGIAPNHDKVESKLKTIDMSLCVLEKRIALEGKNFSVDDYNNMIFEIFTDIKILNAIILEHLIKQYKSCEEYLSAHMNSLSDKINNIDKKISSLNQSIQGEIVFFENKELNPNQENNSLIINLGEIEIDNNSNIICLIDTKKIDLKNIYINIYNNQFNHKSSIYNYNQGFIRIKSNMDLNHYSLKLNNNQNINGLINLNIGEINTDNFYSIFGAKNNILIKNNTSQNLKLRNDNTSLMSFEDKCYIDFYTIGANKIDFNFNKKPLSANFDISNHSININSRIQHFSIEADEGFAFNFNLDKGDIYAINKEGMIINRLLYFDNTIGCTDFYIEEYKKGEPVKCYAKIIIENTDLKNIDINSICIKQTQVGGSI